MIQMKNIVLKINSVDKESFYCKCEELNMTPMRVMIIMMEKFAQGKIDSEAIFERYKQFKKQEVDNKIKRIIKYRIDGGKAYQISNRKKQQDLKLL
jgi:antitoxin component of RelBE/YafQ-DinJ toxin-antitoxin module